MRQHSCARPGEPSVLHGSNGSGLGGTSTVGVVLPANAQDVTLEEGQVLGVDGLWGGGMRHEVGGIPCGKCCRAGPANRSAAQRTGPSYSSPARMASQRLSPSLRSRPVTSGMRKKVTMAPSNGEGREGQSSDSRAMVCLGGPAVFIPGLTRKAAKCRDVEVALVDGLAQQ